MRTLALILTVAMGVGCSLGLDPNANRYSCDTDPDCGKDYECRPQLDGSRGQCFPIGLCVAEVCDGQDNDCNGAIDELWNFATDPSNCGACGHICDVGFECDVGSCVLPPPNPRIQR